MLPLVLYGGVEVGVDEAGRGPLAGPVFAAAVILPPHFWDERLDDSKRMTERARRAVRQVIEREAVDWAVAEASAQEIDRLNILQASFLAMTRAVRGLRRVPSSGIDRLLVDGNRFRSSLAIPHECIVGGDGRLAPIAAASVLAKTHRDERMCQLHERYPHYGWDANKGYGTRAHCAAISAHGPSEHHRRSFLRRWQEPELPL